MQTVIIADVTKPGRYPNTGIAYYFRFTLPDEQALRLKRKFFGNFAKDLSTVQCLKELCCVRRCRR